MKVFLTIFLTATLFATATLTKERTFTQSDGSTFKGRLQGDMRLHWVESKNGSILLFNKKTANFEYAKIEDGDLVLSGDIYTVNKTRSLHVKRDVDKNRLKTLWQERHNIKHN